MGGKERILTVAEDLFVEKGFIGTSMNEIAEKAGVAKSLIYHHFESKQRLWQAMIRDYHDRFGLLEKFYETLSARDPQTLLGLVHGENGFFEFLRSNPRLVRLFSWLNLEREFDPEYPDEDTRKRVLDRIRELQRDGLVRGDIEAGFIPILFMSLMMHWFSARWSLVRWLGTDENDAGLDEKFIHGMMDILLRGIRPDA
jgi:TetR/AcrR family transcriptional regulator